MCFTKNALKGRSTLYIYVFVISIEVESLANTHPVEQHNWKCLSLIREQGIHLSKQLKRRLSCLSSLSRK